MRFRKRFAMMMVAGLAACASPAKPLTQEEVGALPTDTLCWGYAGYGSIGKAEARSSRETIRAELTRRGMISASEWRAVDRRTIARGLGRCAVFAIFGKPLESNKTADMEILGFTGISYVMLQDGVVVNYVGAPQTQ